MIMSGKFLKFESKSETIYTKKSFVEKQKITKHRLESILKLRLSGTFILKGTEWTFEMIYGYEHVDHGGRKKGETGKKWSAKKIKRNIVSKERKPSEGIPLDKCFYQKRHGNFLCTYSSQSKQLISTKWVDGRYKPIKGYTPEHGTESIIDKIISGDIFKFQSQM